jgi:hypothetical protein
MSTPQVEWIHSLRSHPDAFLDQVVSKKDSSTEFEGSCPAQQFSPDENIAEDQKNVHFNLISDKLIRKLPDWLLNGWNPTYDLKHYLSHEVNSVKVHIFPDNGTIEFDTEEWILSHKTLTSECHQYVITIHAYGEELQDHKLFFACNDIVPPHSFDNEYKGAFLRLEQPPNLVGEEIGLILGTHFGHSEFSSTDSFRLAIVPSPKKC